MRWVVESDARAYADRVLPWLAREPVLTTVPATILLGVLDRVYAEAWLAWLADGAGDVAGVALRTPPYGVVLTPLPPGAAAALADVAGDRLPGAAGPRAEVEAFATAYADRHRARAVRTIRQRLFRLAEPAEQAEQAEPAGQAEQAEPTEPAGPAEPAGQAEPAEPAEPAAPRRRAAGCGRPPGPRPSSAPGGSPTSPARPASTPTRTRWPPAAG